MKKNQNIRKYHHNRKRHGIWVSRVLVGMIVIFIALALIIPDKEFSDSENRKLAALPKLGVSAITDGSYFEDLGDYVADQFPGRDFWISVNLWANKLTGQTEFNGVYLCDDDYLIQIPSDPDEENLAKNIAAINTFAEENSSLDIYMSVVPNAVTVYESKLPINAPVRDQRADLKNLASKINDDTQFIDVTQTLISHSEEELYFRTDHHWTSLGAFYAFQQIAGEMGIDAPDKKDYSVYLVSNSFEGTLASKSGSHSVTDSIEIYAPDTEISYYVTYPDDQGSVTTMYNREALDAKDQYTLFFGGNYSRVDITTTADTERNLLVFKDSYANCFMQYLYPYFDHIIMIDPRYYYDNVKTVITSQSITDVLYLYNADTFFGDTSLADVLSTYGTKSLKKS